MEVECQAQSIRVAADVPGRTNEGLDDLREDLRQAVAVEVVVGNITDSRVEFVEQHRGEAVTGDLGKAVFDLDDLLEVLLARNARARQRVHNGAAVVRQDVCHTWEIAHQLDHPHQVSNLGSRLETVDIID